MQPFRAALDRSSFTMESHYLQFNGNDFGSQDRDIISRNRSRSRNLRKQSPGEPIKKHAPQPEAHESNCKCQNIRSNS